MLPNQGTVLNTNRRFKYLRMFALRESGRPYVRPTSASIPSTLAWVKDFQAITKLFLSDPKMP